MKKNGTCAILRAGLCASLLAVACAAGLACAPSSASAAVAGEKTSVALSEASEQSSYNGWALDAASAEYYWFDDGEMAKEKAIYDPGTNAWYWIDDDGTMAFDKDAFIPVTSTDRTKGKWVRLSSDGTMVKGYDQRYDAEYYFDEITGEMLKGESYLELSDTRKGWFNFDLITGKMDVDKDVWITSNGGKWCRYDEQGIMIYGEDYRESPVDGEMHWWYFDEVTGAMATGLTSIPTSDGGTKTVLYDETFGWMLYGTQVVEGSTLQFDSVTGKLLIETTGDSATREKIIEIALSKLGSPYKHAGLGPDEFSCDGFTAWVYTTAGVKVYDSIADSSFNGQYAYLNARGKIVTSIDELKVGDILFFGTSFGSMRHAAIYYGTDSSGTPQMIHSSGHYVNGERVGVTISALDSDFLGGGSPLD